MTDMRSLADIQEEFEFLEKDDRHRLIIDLGRSLEAMPDVLKTPATLVRGCQAQVWTYPIRNDDGSLHFLADSTSAITKGIIALVLTIVQDQQPKEILAVDMDEALRPFELQNHLTSNRTGGIPNMIALIRETAGRYTG
ncbi:SufE family protein [Sphingobium sp. YR768]|uniref:SufE family protein n=1 Tax=Sphingobium sp. YR768 TaxID=1884365 RepID=UPI000B80741E|nr:SufE family protein [Sphingobium sp. YR768]